VKHAKSAAARLCSPLHPPALTSGLHRWLSLARWRSRRPSPGVSTPAGTISQCQLPNLHRGAFEARKKRRRTPLLACARRYTHQVLPLACSGGCAWSSGAVGGPPRAHRRPQGRFHSANCQICTGARLKHAQSTNARLCSPLHPPELTYSLFRWLSMVKRRSRRPAPGVSTLTGAISQCQLPNLHKGAFEARAEQRRTPLLARARRCTH
jgi:hypothetical protein